MPTIFVVSHGGVSLAVSTMKKGVVDFIEKPFSKSELRELVERMPGKARNENSVVREQRIAEDLFGRLTTREQQVLERIVARHLNKRIADSLGISVKMVEVHCVNIMKELDMNTVADLLRLALPHNA